MMKKILLLSLVGLPLVLLAQSPRILPLGNSITQADKTHFSYRYPLWQKLRSAGIDFDFIGTMNTNYGGNPSFPDLSFDKDHEGHRGWRADQLLAGLPSWLATYTPDIVLVHAGTNDMFMGNSVSGTVEELKKIIDALRSDNPDVSILLAKIIGTTAPENTRIVELNSYIDGIAAAKNTSRSRVLVVDQYTGFHPSTDTYDGKHPNADGEEKMAQKWFDALMTIMDVTPPITPGGTGLAAEYYNAIDFTGPMALNRTEPEINFSWGYGSPGPAVNINYFSARWTGMVEAPVSGNYKFSTTSDDGVRLWVNNALVINNWTDHGSTTDNSPLIALSAGVRYDIRMEYYEKSGGAVARLWWTYPGQSLQIIPQERLYSSTSIADTEPPSVPTSLSSSNITQTGFALSWAASTDNKSVTGYEVFLNGTTTGTVSTTTKMISGLSPATSYAMTVRARDAAGNWSAKSNALQVTTAGASSGDGTGLSGAYYNTKDLTGAVALSRIEPHVNFNWGYGSPGAAITTNNFSARWTGSVHAPVSGNYTFSTVSDDGVRLWVDDVLVINNWTDHGSTTNNSHPVALVAGARYNIKMEYYENSGAAVAKLMWTYPGQSQHPIPQARLFPSSAVTEPEAPTSGGGGLSGYYFNTIDLSGSVVLSRIEDVDFDWRYSSPGSPVNTGNFSVRWSGSVEAPISGNYTFSTVSDDGVRLWVNNVLVIDNWTDHGTTTNNSNLISLAAGSRYPLRMEYYEKGGVAVARLQWSYPGQTRHAIPANQLYPGVEQESAARMSTVMRLSTDEGQSSAITAEDVSLEYHAVAVYPNPANTPSIYISFYSGMATSGDISVLPAHGPSVVRMTRSLVKGINVVEIPTTHLHNGIYVVVVSSSSSRLVARFVIAR